MKDVSSLLYVSSLKQLFHFARLYPSVLAAVIRFSFLAILHEGFHLVFAVTLSHSNAPWKFTDNTAETRKLTPNSDIRFPLSIANSILQGSLQLYIGISLSSFIVMA